MACPLLSALFVFVFLVFGYAGEDSAAQSALSLKKGRTDLDEGNFESAVRNFTSARKEIRLLDDYALLYLSEAYHSMGDHQQSLRTVRTLMALHPRSPVVRTARTYEIREARETNEGALEQLFLSYLDRYPDDDEVRFLFGMFLGESGKEEQARKVFRDIYVGAGALARSAHEKLSPGDVTPDDLLERAQNLVKMYEYSEAEADLRKAIRKTTGGRKQTMMRYLALSLFRQKKYAEAARVYGSIGDRYYEARSYYRAGDAGRFNRSLAALLKSSDSRAGEILLVLAGDARRRKEFESAIQKYRDIIERYPAEKEEALWGIGWSYFLSGNYGESRSVFARLQETYDDPQYLYWEARSVEESGGDAGPLYERLIGGDENFYSFLAAMRVKTGLSLFSPVQDEPSTPPAVMKRERFRRVEVLQAIGFTDEALTELTEASRTIGTPEEFLYLVKKFQELGEFKRAAALAEMLPYSEPLHRFWYPLAYWDTVNEVASKYDMNPFVILSVMREESRFDIHATSPAGARGLMQLMPETAYRLDRKVGLGIRKSSHLYDPGKNIGIGTYYLDMLFREFRSFPHVLAAYNAGESIVRKWQARGAYESVDVFIEDIPYRETRKYVKKVVRTYFQYRKYDPEKQDVLGFALAPGSAAVLSRLFLESLHESEHDAGEYEHGGYYDPVAYLQQ